MVSLVGMEKKTSSGGAVVTLKSEPVVGDSYDSMIERLSYKFSSALKPRSRASGESEEPSSMVFPHSEAPVPQTRSQHPYQSSNKTLFPSSPNNTASAATATAMTPDKRIYDASLGTYSLIQY
jgi:hypothetical protein